MAKNCSYALKHKLINVFLVCFLLRQNFSNTKMTPLPKIPADTFEEFNPKFIALTADSALTIQIHT